MTIRNFSGILYPIINGLVCRNIIQYYSSTQFIIFQKILHFVLVRRYDIDYHVLNRLITIYVVSQTNNWSTAVCMLIVSNWFNQIWFYIPKLPRKSRSEGTHKTERSLYEITVAMVSERVPSLKGFVQMACMYYIGKQNLYVFCTKSLYNSV